MFRRVIQCVPVLSSCTINLPQSVGTTARVKLNCHLVSNNVLVPLELIYMHFVEKRKIKPQCLVLSYLKQLVCRVLFQKNTAAAHFTDNNTDIFKVYI